MRNRLSGRATRRRSRWATVAGLGQVHWFFGNVYEAAVGMPELLAAAKPNREPGVLGVGSPVRYYLPAPITATASMASAGALTGYLVRTVNLPLLRGDNPVSAADRRRLARTWHRGNLVRLLFLVLAAWALRRASEREVGA